MRITDAVCNVGYVILKRSIADQLHSARNQPVSEKFHMNYIWFKHIRRTQLICICISKCDYYNSLPSQNELAVTKAPDLMHINAVLVAHSFCISYFSSRRRYYSRAIVSILYAVCFTFIMNIQYTFSYQKRHRCLIIYLNSLPHINLLYIINSTSLCLIIKQLNHFALQYNQTLYSHCYKHTHTIRGVQWVGRYLYAICTAHHRT